MRLTVLGSCGAWPEAGQACSGYLVEHDGFRLLVDVGYAVVPRLLRRVGAAEVDAVLISHGHPDLLAEASYVEQVPEDSRGYLSSARQQGRQAAEAAVRHLMLSHLMPGTDPAAARAAAQRGYHGEVTVASAGLALDVG